ncbi:endonuclease/exonuclease/phosphatase family protein [Pseudodesulfovibrio pelocollis]|uniref:endonuclease/exonuclease/phosphatase family protein n=1 Tax=Pseudodesulfovibrio pelocollis TaxID=3051432 RepID=UPI00255ABF0B|nr:endonuclease/exonuclease/phosphatase family protein [Pseudodesulfovibrio sp. SB368]
MPHTRHIALPFLALATLVLILIPCSPAQGQPKTAGELTVTTWNVQFMWDGVLPEEGQLVRKTPEEAAKHMTDISTVIRQIDPDILNLVEVENIDALNLLNSRYLNDLRYSAFLENGTDTYTGQDVGLLTRVKPIQAIKRYSHRGKSDDVEKSVSKNYYALFHVEDVRFAVITLHFLAIPTHKGRVFERQAQAEAMAHLARFLIGHGYEIIMLGDFNDYDGQVLDLNQNRPITKVLEICKLMTDDDPSNDLTNVAMFIEQDQRFTAHYDKNKNGKIDGRRELSAIDHILVSSGIVERLHRVWIHQQQDAMKASDHFPVNMTFSTSKQMH